MGYEIFGVSPREFALRLHRGAISIPRMTANDRTTGDTPEVAYELPGIGGLTRDGESRPVEIPALGRTVIFEVVDPGELTDEELAAAADAIANFRRLPRNFFRDRATRAVARGSRSTA